MESILNYLAPFDCLVCGTEGLLICDRCWSDTWPVAKQGIPVELDEDSLVTVWAVTLYTGVAKALVHHMKINCQRQACRIIARAIHEHTPTLLPDTIVSSVPTATRRVRERGFDHGQLIAREFARLRGFQYKVTLRRYGQAKQAGANTAARQQHTVRAYQMIPGLILDGPLLIIDDVITTGQTLHAVTTVLRAGGVKQVTAAVFARTVQG